MARTKETARKVTHIPRQAGRRSQGGAASVAAASAPVAPASPPPAAAAAAGGIQRRGGAGSAKKAATPASKSSASTGASSKKKKQAKKASKDDAEDDAEDEAMADAEEEDGADEAEAEEVVAEAAKSDADGDDGEANGEEGEGDDGEEAKAKAPASASKKGQKRARSTKKEKKVKADSTAAAASAPSPTRRSSRSAHPRQDLGFVVAAFDSEDEANLQRSESDAEDEEEDEEDKDGDKSEKSAAEEEEEEQGEGSDAAPKSDAEDDAKSKGKGQSKGKGKGKTAATGKAKRKSIVKRETDSEGSGSDGDAGDDGAYGSSGPEEDDDDNDGDYGRSSSKKKGGGSTKKRAGSPSPRKARASAGGAKSPRAKAAAKPRAKREPKAKAAKAPKKPKKKKLQLCPLEDAELLAALELVEDASATGGAVKAIPGLSKAAQAARAKEAAAKAAQAQADHTACCSLCASRAAHRAVESNNLKLLESLCADYAHVASPLLPWSADVCTTPMQRAIIKGDRFMVRKLLHEQNLSFWAKRAQADLSNRANRGGYSLRALGGGANDEDEVDDGLPADHPRPATAKRPAIRVGLPVNQLEKQSTGKASYVAYGHRVAQVNLSRGGKEGNNAFVNDNDLGYKVDDNFDYSFKFLMSHGSNPDLIDVFAQTIDCRRTTYENAQAQLNGIAGAGAGGAGAGANALPADKPGLAKQKSQLKDALSAAAAATAAAAAGVAAPVVPLVFDCHTREDAVHTLLSNGAFKLAVVAGNLPLVRRALEFSQKRSGTTGTAAEFAYSRMGGFTKIFLEVVAADGAPLSAGYKAASVTKKGGGHSDALTPVHLAAINPDTQYLRALAEVIGVQAMMQVTDDQQRGPVFYAAACSSPEPLRWLLSQGANPFEKDRKMQTPLDIAVQAGRAENIALLVPQVANKPGGGGEDEEDGEGKEDGAGSEAVNSEANEDEDGEGEGEDDEGGDDDDEGSDAPRRKKRKTAPKKAAKGKKAKAKQPLAMSKDPLHLGPTKPSPQSSINAKHKKTNQTLLHTACTLGDARVVSELLKAGADVFAANKEKQTGLVLACQQGHTEVVKVLYEHVVSMFSVLDDSDRELTAAHKRLFLAMDKVGRLPIFHAVKNGHFELVKYLLLLGYPLDACDSSSNNLVHYAAAYGWADIVEMILVFVRRAEAETTVASLAGAPSIWKTTPLFVACLKGHLRVAAAVLSAPNVDVNARDSDGLTILHHVVNSKNRGLEQARRQLHFLIDERKADVKLKDPKTQRNVLHMLAALPYTPPPPAAAHKPADAAEEEEKKQSAPAPSAKPAALKRSKSKVAAAAMSDVVPAGAAAPAAEDDSSDASLAAMFLAQGVDVNLVDDAGHSAVMLALAAQNFPLVRFLLARGARINMSYGAKLRHETPLMRLLGLRRPPTKSEEAYEAEAAREKQQREARRGWGSYYNQEPTAEQKAEAAEAKARYLASKAANDAQYDRERQELFELMLTKAKESSDPLRDPLGVGEVVAHVSKKKSPPREPYDGEEFAEGDDDNEEEEEEGSGGDDEDEEEDEEGGSDDDGSGAAAKEQPTGDAEKVKLDADGVPIAQTLHYLNGRDSTGATLLFHCLRAPRNSSVLLETLLSHTRECRGTPGCTLDLNVRDSSGRTVVFHAVAAKEPAKPVQLLRILLEYAAQINGGANGVPAGKLGKKSKAAASAAGDASAAAPALDLHIVTRDGLTLPAAIIRLSSSSSPVLVAQLLAELVRAGQYDLASTADWVSLHRRATAPPNPPPIDPAHPDVVPLTFSWDMELVRRSHMIERGVAHATQPTGASDKVWTEMKDQLVHYDVERQSFFSFLVRAFLSYASSHALVSNPAFKAPMPVKKASGRGYDPSGKAPREVAAWLQVVRMVLQSHKASGVASLRALVGEDSFGTPEGFHENLMHHVASFVAKTDLQPLLQLLAEFIPRDALVAAGAQADKDGCTPLLRLVQAGLAEPKLLALPAAGQPLARPQVRLSLAEALKTDLQSWEPEDDVAPTEEEMKAAGVPEAIVANGDAQAAPAPAAARPVTGSKKPRPSHDIDEDGSDGGDGEEDEEMGEDGEDMEDDGEGEDTSASAAVAPASSPFSMVPTPTTNGFSLDAPAAAATPEDAAAAAAREPASLSFVLSHSDLQACVGLLVRATGSSIDEGVRTKWWDPKLLQRKKVANAAGAAAGGKEQEQKDKTADSDEDDPDDDEDDDDEEDASKTKKAAAPIASSASASAAKKPCPFGAKCYRKNPVHFAEFSHPGDKGAQFAASMGVVDGSAAADGASAGAAAAAAQAQGELIIPPQENLGQTALHLSVLKGAEPLVAYLLQTLKASPLAKDNRQRLPLHLAAVVAATSTAIPTLLLQSHAREQVLARDGNGAHALSLVCQATSNVALASFLLRQGGAADAQALAQEQVRMANAQQRTALHFAVNYSCRRHGDDGARGYEESFGMEALLLRHGADINATDSDGRTCLHYAFVPVGAVYVAQGTAAQDPIEVVSDICAVQPPDAKAAGRSASNGAAGALVRGGSFIHKSVDCFVSVDVADRFGRTPLLYAAALGAQISCKYLQQRGASLRTIDGDGNGVFQHALRLQRMSLAVDLIDHGVELQRPIHPALQETKGSLDRAKASAAAGDADASELVTKLEKELKAAALDRVSAFGFVLRRGWIGLGYLMVDAGLPICTAVGDALGSHLLSLVWTLLQKTSPSKLGDVDANTGRNLFHLLANYAPKDDAARKAYEDTWSLRFAELLARAGVEPDVPDAVLGYTPLHLACVHGHATLVRFLLGEKKVRPDVRGLNGYTPLLEAAAHRQTAMVQLLLSHDTKLFARAEKQGLSQGLDGLTALHWAVAHNDLTLVGVLLQLGAPVNPVLLREPSSFRPHWWKAPGAAAAEDDEALAESRRHQRERYSLKAHKWTAVHSYRRGTPNFMHPLSPLQVALCAATKSSSLNWELIKVLLAYGSSPNLVVLDWLVGGKEELQELGGAGTSVTTQAALKGEHRLMALLLHEADPVEQAAEKKRLASTPVPPPPAPTAAQLLIRSAPKQARTPNALGSTVDAQGRTIVHRLVAPAGYGLPSAEDVSLLRRVVQASRNGVNEPANLEARDAQGRTPLTYAMQQGSGRMKEALLELGAKKPDAKAEKAAQDALDKLRQQSKVDWAEAEKILPPVDAAADAAAVEAAEAARLEAEEENGLVAVELPKVDPLAGDLAKTCTVYRDPASGIIYDLYMTCTEVNSGYYGKHSFYKASVLWNPLQSLPILWTRWGRVGEDGQYQRTPFSTLDACTAEFLKIFRSKSGNNFLEAHTRKTFKPIDGKYHLQFTRGAKGKEQALLQPLDTIVARLDAAKLPPAVSHARVQALVRLFCDTGRLHTLLRKLGFQEGDDEEGDSMLARLNKAVLEEAHGKLKEIAALIPKLKHADAALQAQHTLRQQVERQIEIKQREALDAAAAAEHDDGGQRDMDMADDDEADEEAKAVATPKKRAGAAAASPLSPEPELSLAPITAAIARLQDEKATVESQLSALSNAFFQLCPQPSFASSAIRSITSMEDVHRYVAQLLQFIDVGATARLLLGCQLRPYDLHPVDYAYAGLGVRMSALSRKDPAFQLVERYVHVETDRRQLELWNVFAVERRGEVARFDRLCAEKKIGNHALLWHGSGIVNFNGILSQGLRIAPPEADASGLAFGKGVYFADSVTKSLGYCRDFSGSFGNMSAAAAQNRSRYNRYGSSSNDDDDVDPTASKCLLLCEVALGTSFEAHEAEYMEAPKPGTHSTKALGARAPDASRSVTTPEGVLVPCGPLVSVSAPEGWVPARPPPASQSYTCVGANEYIVYDEAQVRMRYLVQVGPPRKKYLRRLEKQDRRKAKHAQREREEREKAFAGEA